MAASSQESKYQIVLASSYRPLIEALALEYGFSWGGRGNVKAFIEAIARKEISLFPSGTAWSKERQTALMKAVLALCESADVVSVREIIKHIEEHPEFEAEYRAKIQDSCKLFLSPWLSKINQLITGIQPFQLSYQDAAGRLWTYTIKYAEITFREKRNYLECWCEETEGNQDLPELKHNWSLRLDRIIDVGIVPIDGEWRSGLDTVDVEFELYGGLAHAYIERDNDIHLEWVSVDPPSLRVVRQISNTFWFLREVLPYGKDCVVRSPDSVRQLVLEHYSLAKEQYEK